MSEKKNKKTERMVWDPLRAVAGKAMLIARAEWAKHGKIWRFFHGRTYKQYERDCIRAALTGLMLQSKDGSIRFRADSEDVINSLQK